MNMIELFSNGLCWVTLGAMILFGATIAPTVFSVLEPDAAGKFLRALFPKLYLFCGITSGVAAILYTVSTTVVPAILVGLVSVLFFFSRGPLTRRVNEARDDELAGVAGAKTRFDKLHKQSVRIFGAQALVLIASLVCTQVW